MARAIVNMNLIIESSVIARAHIKAALSYLDHVEQYSILVSPPIDVYIIRRGKSKHGHYKRSFGRQLILTMNIIPIQNRLQSTMFLKARRPVAGNSTAMDPWHPYRIDNN